MEACNGLASYENGATRSIDTESLDYEGFLSPAVLERYAQYIHKHRFMKDGTLRDSDNWQLGIPLSRFMKSMWRHFLEVHFFHRSAYSRNTSGNTREEALCALLFNVMGYLHELLKHKVHDLKRCDAEIERCEKHALTDDASTGPLLGLQDWSEEKRRIIDQA
jgi:hypothetical protein